MLVQEMTSYQNHALILMDIKNSWTIYPANCKIKGVPHAPDPFSSNRVRAILKAIQSYNENNDCFTFYRRRGTFPIEKFRN